MSEDNNNANCEVDEQNTVAYWKAKYEEVAEQFDEFTRDSRELEAEMEVQIQQSEQSIRALSRANDVLHHDNDTYKDKLNDVTTSTHRQISSLQADLAKFKAHHDSNQLYIRELEQTNDSLENAHRAAQQSLKDFEDKMYNAVEANTLLESQVLNDQMSKEQLAESVQRLRDEARDLRQELAARQVRSMSTTNNGVFFPPADPINVEMESTSSSLISDLMSGLSKSSRSNSNACTTPHHHHVLKPNVRINALELVNSTLNKISAIESRLVEKRNAAGSKERRSATISGHESTNFANGKGNSIAVVPTSSNAVY